VAGLPLRDPRAHGLADAAGGDRLIGAKLDLPTVAVIGWFGPRGLASVVFALPALDGLLPDDGIRVVSIITATVLMSVILHGATAAPISWRYSGGSTVPATEPR
jgi:NhaP-type Na+/H+ or K+/H+ antiporter